MAILIDYTYTGQVTIDVYNVRDLVLAADLLSFINLRYEYYRLYHEVLHHMNIT